MKGQEKEKSVKVKYAAQFVVEIRILDGAALLFSIHLNLHIIVQHHKSRLRQLYNLYTK